MELVAAKMRMAGAWREPMREGFSKNMQFNGCNLTVGLQDIVSVLWLRLLLNIRDTPSIINTQKHATK